MTKIVHYVKMTELNNQRGSQVKTYTLGFPKIFQNSEGHVIIFKQMVGDGITNPGCSLSRAQPQKLVSGFLRKIQIDFWLLNMLIANTIK